MEMTYLHPFPPPARKDAIVGGYSHIARALAMRLEQLSQMSDERVFDQNGRTQQDYETSEVESPGTCAQMTAQAGSLADSPGFVMVEPKELKPGDSFFTPDGHKVVIDSNLVRVTPKFQF